MLKIRKRRIFEDDANQQQPTDANQQQPTDANQQQGQQQAQQPQQTQQPQQGQQQQQGQQPADANQQQAQQQNPEDAKKAEELQAKVKEILEKNLNNVYWAICNDVAAYIQQQIPDFKQGNEKADAAIKAWEECKKDPKEETYKAFLQAFEQFGTPEQAAGGGQQQGQQPQQAQQQPQQGQQSADQNQQQNVNASYDTKSFSDRLNEKLQIKLQKQYYNSICEKYNRY